MTVPPVCYATLFSTLPAVWLRDRVRLAELDAAFFGTKVPADPLDMPAAFAAMFFALNARVQNAVGVNCVAHSTNGRRK